MAKKTLIITDVTAMKGDNVCIAGYDSSITCIRPVLSMGQIKKRHLFQAERLIIYPGAKVTFYFVSKNPQPPHTEDYIFKDDSIEYEGRATTKEWREVLQETTLTSFEELFPNLEKRYVPPGSPGPSIGTFHPGAIPFLYRRSYNDKHSLRMRIHDSRGVLIEDVPITDLAFRHLFEDALQRYRNNCEKAVISLNQKLDGREIYLRLGLTRPFMQAPAPYSGWCCLQVNGVHTLPDLYDRNYDDWITLE